MLPEWRLARSMRRWPTPLLKAPLGVSKGHGHRAQPERFINGPLRGQIPPEAVWVNALKVEVAAEAALQASLPGG